MTACSGVSSCLWLSSQYWKDPYHYSKYLADNIFLADINNEREPRNETYKVRRLISTRVRVSFCVGLCGQPLREVVSPCCCIPVCVCGHRAVCWCCCVAVRRAEEHCVLEHNGSAVLAHRHGRHSVHQVGSAFVAGVSLHDGVSRQCVWLSVLAVGFSSPIFEFYALNQSTNVVPLNETDTYLGDWIGTAQSVARVTRATTCVLFSVDPL